MSKVSQSKKKDPWLEEFSARVNAFALVGKYKEGLAVARQGLRERPRELTCRYLYAKLLGDWADELPLSRRKKLKTEAVRILGPLLRRVTGLPVKERFGISLNYYYQSYAFRDMHAYGRRVGRHDRRRGLYAEALGAGLYAEELARTGGRNARAWALKSVRAWSRYGLRGEKYYFAHYSSAKARALAGDGAGAMRDLKTAARLAGRPVSDWEFRDALELVARNQRSSFS